MKSLINWFAYLAAQPDVYLAQSRHISVDFPGDPVCQQRINLTNVADWVFPRRRFYPDRTVQCDDTIDLVPTTDLSTVGPLCRSAEHRQVHPLLSARRIVQRINGRGNPVQCPLLMCQVFV